MGSVGSVHFHIAPCSTLRRLKVYRPRRCLVSVNYRVLICCTCHFQSGSLFFVYFGLFCKSLQCLISTLTQGGKDGHLLRLTCSVVLWGGSDTANKYYWCVWGALAVHGPHWVCPAHGVCGFPVCTAQAPGCSAGALSKADAAFCALPRSEQLRQPAPWPAHCPRWAPSLTHLLGPSPSVPRVPCGSAVSGVPCISSGELVSGCDPASYLPGPSPLVSQVRCGSAVPGVLCVSSGELVSGCDPASYSPSRSQPLGSLGALREHRFRCAVCLLWGAGLRL